jgi:hypothetical protein
VGDEAAVIPAPTVPGVEIKSGPTTSEYAAMQNSAWWGKAMMILGIVSTTISGVVQGIHQYQATVAVPGQPVPGGSQLALVLMIAGIALAVIGGIQKTLTEMKYIEGRSVLKAAALRDAPTAPPVV